MINGMIIKVCGMRSIPNIQEVEALDEIDLMGFIFYPPSPRYISERPYYLPNKSHRTGVFVNETKETVNQNANLYELEYIQLHGNESPEYCLSLHQPGRKIIKAFSIASAKDLEATELYNNNKVCDYFLFDTKCKEFGEKSEHSLTPNLQDTT